MAPVCYSEVLNWPYVNLPINAEQSRITSALIDLRRRMEFGRRESVPEMRWGGDHIFSSFSGRGRWDLMCHMMSQSLISSAALDWNQGAVAPSLREDYTPTPGWGADEPLS